MTTEKTLPANPMQPIVHQPYYDQDGITIYHGDAMLFVDALSMFDAVVTDPPYGIVGKFGSSDLYGTRNMQFAFDQPEDVMEQVAAIVDVVASKAKA